MTPYEHPRDYPTLCAAVDKRADRPVMTQRTRAETYYGGKLVEALTVRRRDPLPEAEAGWALLECIPTTVCFIRMNGRVACLIARPTGEASIRQEAATPVLALFAAAWEMTGETP